MSRLVPWVLLLGLCAPASVAAQDSPDVPAHIAFIDGAATLERDGRSESAPASMPLLAGDRVRTQNGRVEILFADSSTLHLDANTLVDFQSDEVVRLLTGRLRLNIIHQAGSSRRVAYRVDAPSAWVEIVASGEYKISVIGGERDAEIEMAVLRGAADLVNEDGRSSLRAGERAFARAGVAPSAAYVFNSASWDAFDRWSESRRETRLGVSAQYLPETVQSYASTFNDYGYWNYMPTYGYVWYPRVHPGWRPYYYGSWRTLRPWGWTWIGSDPWAWPTHHFGRWGFNAGLWFWIPGRHWGPAWVSWAYAPGYVSWCPLGWNNRPVAFFGSGFRHNPWHAWTVVPHRGFGRGFVNVNVVNATHIDARTRSSFVVRDTSPDVRGYAVPRASAPIRVAGTRGGSIDGGATAFRGSVTPGARTAPSAADDAAAAFRSRRSSGAPSSGPGFPAPAREPRVGSSVAVPNGARSRSDGGAPAAPGGISSAERRAVPRNNDVSSAPVDVSPSPRTAPEYRRSAPDTNPADNVGRYEGYRAVPRNRGTDNPVYAPPPSYRAPQERSPYAAPPDADRGQRAMPKSAPDGGGPPAGYRSRPGIERAPSAPPPSAPSRDASPPSRPSGPPAGSNNSGGNSGGNNAGARSRGDGQATGRAVSRGRGGD